MTTGAHSIFTMGAMKEFPHDIAPEVGVFARLGRWCYRRRRLVVLVWLAAAVLGGAASSAAGSRTATEFTMPDVESRRGVDIVEDHFGGNGAGANGSIVFRTDESLVHGVDDPTVRAAIDAFLAEVESMEQLTIVSPYSPQGAHQIANHGDLAGRLAYAAVEVPPEMSFEVSEELGHRIRDGAPDIAGVQIEVGGQMFAEFDEPQAEIIGVALAIIILIVSFGSVTAMGLPIATGLAGIGVGTILAGFAGHVFEVPDFAQMVGIMIGLGVGIDYALFIVTRFRESRRAGHDIERSITIAVDTAGRAVAFAGATVVISLLGMLLMQVPFITGMAISAATVVSVTVLASLTLLVALVGFVGERIEVTRWRGVIAAGLVSIALLGVGLGVDALTLALPLAIVVLLAGFALRPLRRELPPRRQRPTEAMLAYRWSRTIQRNPGRAALAATALLVLLSLPVLGMRLGFADEGNYASDTDTRRAYDLLADGFGPGYNGPLLLAAELPDAVDASVLDRIATTLGEHPGVAYASPPNVNDEFSPTAVVWQVIPTTAPQAQATADLVHQMRSDVLPRIAEASALDIAVTGSTAIGVDFSTYLGDRLPVFLAAVMSLSFLLLMIVFRSILVPLKAVVMNLLGIGAAYGVVVAVFQWGWFGSVLGVEAAPIEPFMPMMLFAIVFGLSMDYEVFLLSRIKEDWDRTGDSHTSVANGLAATARVISAAALIMIVVFTAFALGDDRTITMAGVGLATAVFLDATVIRMLLVPATMELLGDRNWWLPAWLNRILPRVDVEGHSATDATLPIADDASDRELEPV